MRFRLSSPQPQQGRRTLYRLASKTYPDQTSVDYAYDLAGKVQQVSDPTGTYSFAYDNMGRLIGTTTQYAFLPGVYSNAYTYDAASNRKSLTGPDGSITTYGYDTLNRLNGLANSWAGSFGFGYDGLSRRTSLTRPNGVNTSYSYDSLSHLLSVLHQAGNTVLDGASYTYDAAGNRTSKTNDLNGVTSNYGYDPLYQLTQVTQGAVTTESYSYDSVGNRMSSSGVLNYTYNASNELMSNSAGSYTYDNNGNTLTDAQGRSYAWDFENRLMQAVVPQTGGGSNAVTFKYDPFGRRIQKNGPLGTTNYLYDGADVSDEIDQNGNALAYYAPGPETDESLSMLRSGATSYYLGDALDSTTSLSSSSGTLTNTYTYDSYGRTTASSGTVTNPYRFAGREFDSETSIYYNRARYYDESTGRFLSEDPAKFGGGIDFYGYANNNPAIFVDPSGLAPDCQNCKIDVKCRGIQTKHLGALGFKHCDAQVTDSNGVTHSLSGGPNGPYNNSTLGGWDTPNPSGSFTGRDIYHNNNANCDTANCLISHADAYQANTAGWPKYKYLGGPNSNTWLRDLFGGCGINLHERWYGPPITHIWPLP
ncbi:MAG TPA: RHS repeat-associated core domain-containing protein [Candidatus Sulfotelmatobacter sp.]|nr:RHS repeat-associated core domain-containing protein [Candidatus Sulfotelmatobacter sp.]